MQNIVDLQAWSQFGLGGLVILTLFVFIYYITKQARTEAAPYPRRNQPRWSMGT